MPLTTMQVKYATVFRRALDGESYGTISKSYGDVSRERIRQIFHHTREKLAAASYFTGTDQQRKTRELRSMQKDKDVWLTSLDNHLAVISKGQ